MLNKILTFLLILTINFVHLATPALVLAEELSSPQPTETATPSSTPEPSAEPTSTPVPTPSPTPEPSETPSPSPILVEQTPIAIASSTPTPIASSTPDSSSASPSATPTLTATNKKGEKRENQSNVSKGEDLKKDSQKGYKEGEVLVKYRKSKINLQSLTAPIQTYFFKNSHHLTGEVVIKDQNIELLKAEKSTQDLIDELKSDPNVEIVSPNFKHYPTEISNDPYVSLQWALNNTGESYGSTNDADIDAPEAWNLEKDSQPAITVAVIDTGVKYDHEDLQNNVWDGTNCKDENGNSISGGCPNHGWDYQHSDNDPMDDAGHGTHVSGIIAAVNNNSSGVSGVSAKNKIKIMAIKIGDWNYGWYDYDIIKAISFAEKNGAKVINASFGGGGYNPLFKEAIDNFDGIFVAAAGNGGWDREGDDNDQSLFYPASFESSNIIAVAATTSSDKITNFSNYGKTTVDLGAPGYQIYSTISSHSEYGYPYSESFNDVTPPNIPSNLSKTGDWGTVKLDNSSSSLNSNPTGGGPGPIDNNVLVADLTAFNNKTAYANNVNTTVTLNESYDLSGADSADFYFNVRCDTEYFVPAYLDYLALDVITDGSKYAQIAVFDEVVIDWVNGDPLDGTGEASTYTKVNIPSNYYQNNFKFRFKWVTDESNSGDTSQPGCYVDNIALVKEVSVGGGYTYMNGTSMAAPFVAGAVASVESFNSLLTNSQVKDIVLNSGDPISDLNGKTVSGKRINLYNALVQAGQTPQPSPTPSPTPTPTPSPSATPSPTPTPTPSPSPIPSPSPTPTPTPSPTPSPTPTPIPNNPPVANNVEVTTSEDTAITFNMSVTDADNNALSYTIVNQPAHGQLEFNVGVGNLPNGGGITNPTVIYTPDANFNGTDEFTYKGNDGISDSNTAKATITVTAVNDAPVAKNLNLSTNEDTGLKVVMEGNDVDGDSLSYITLASPSHGQLIFPSGNLVMYLPDLNYNGPDSFTYKVNDGKLDSNVATVNISVLAVNDAPVALDGKVTTDEDIPVNFNLSSTDVENDNLIYTIVSKPTKGFITYIEGTKFTYTPNKDQNGTDFLTFKVNDGPLDSNTAFFTFTINPVNDAPVADDFLVTTNEDTIFPVIFAEKDIDGDILYHTIVSQPAHGQLVNPSNNAIKYIPDSNYNGVDSFTYQLKDENLSSNIATVNITVNPVNDAPNIIGINVTPVNPKTNSILSVESSADDIEEDKITFKYQWKKNKEDLKEETQTSLDLSKAGNGDKGDKISVTVISSDGQDSSSKTSDEVTIGNTAPVTVNDTLLTTQNNALTFKAYVLSGNDTDLDTKDKLEVTAVASLIHGTAALKDGNITFTPEEGYIGNANLIYTVSDGSEEAVGSLTINIIEPLNSGKTIIAPVVNVEPEKPQIVIGNTNVDSVINVPSTVNNASLDTTNVLTISGQTKEAAIPNNISVNTESSLGTLSIAIPAGITVSGPNNWNGNITLPNLLSSSSVTPPATPGTTVQTTGVIEIGAGDTPLSLSKAVRLVIPGKAGQLTGFTRGVTFTAINTICTGDSQTAGDSLGEGADCKIDSGSDLVIWTKHFTKFITYTQTNNPASGGTGSGTSANSGSGSNNGSANAPLCSDAKPGSAPTLVSAKAGENMVTLTWNKAQDPVTYYLVAYGAEKGKIKFGNPNVGDKNTLSYTVKNLSGGVTYYFKVRAGNNCMPGDFSNELAATPYGSLITGSAEGFEAGVLGEIPDSTPSAVLEASKNVTEGSKEANKSSSRWLILAGIFLGMLTLGVGLRKLRGKKLAPKKIVARSRKFTSRKKR